MKRAANVCLIGNMLGDNTGHSPAQSQLLARLLASEGHQVTCASGKLNRLARAADIASVLIAGRRNFDSVLLDVYSGAYFCVADMAVRLCKLFGIPLIAVLRGGQLPEFARRFPRRSRRVLARTDALVAPSHFLAGEFGELGYDVKVIPNVVDLALYPFRERSKVRPRLIWMRSFHPIYNPEMAIRVLAKLRKTEPSATLTMAGSDKGLESEVKTAASRAGVENAVRFVGFLGPGSKLGEMSEADIYINTNRADNMPVTVVEARAMGLAVVATDVGGLPFVIEDGVNGYLVASDDADAMVRKIKILLDHPDVAARFSRNGRAIAERSGWAAVKPLWEELIHKVGDAKRSDAKRSRRALAAVNSDSMKN